MTASGSAAGRIYSHAILRESHRVLGMMDREPYSPTRGLMDRTFWGWKFTDFPGARFQEGVCLLSFLYATRFEGNPYQGNPRLLDWIGAGFDAWSRIQYAAGEFDEAYPFEHSLAATAFTGFYLGEAWEFVGDELPDPVAGRFRSALAGAGRWLAANDEHHGFLTNHLAAAAGASYHAFRVCGDAAFERRSRYFVDKILAHQSEEGWYDEYGGADPGYQTHGSFYLARLYELSGDDRLPGSLDRSFEFLKHFVHPDGSLGGEYASRNTQFYYPAAFEMRSGVDGSACWIATAMQDSVTTGAAAGAASMDAYNYFPLLNNYVFAWKACQAAGHRGAEPAPPSAEPGTVHFPAGGLLKRRTEAYDLYVGLAKGGVVQAFDRRDGRMVCSDGGYLGRVRGGGLVSSQSQVDGRPATVDPEQVVVGGRFYTIGKPLMSPLKFLLFRIFSLTFGRIGSVGYWLKRVLVRALIYKRNEVPIEFERRITTTSRGFTIRDSLRGSPSPPVERLSRVDRFTTIHMGSSKYFLPNELSGEDATVDVDLRQLPDGLTVERRIVVDQDAGAD